MAISHGTSRMYATGCRCDPCRDKHNARTQRWRDANPDAARRQYATYRARHGDRARAASARWRAEHVEERRAYDRRRYAAGREAQLARGRDYYARNGKQRRAYTRAWIASRPDYRLKWRNENREHVRAYDRMAAQRRRATGSLTTAEWEEILLRFDGQCAYCGMRARLEVEHRIPIARGGTNTRENIVPACRSCNARKHTLTDVEFRARGAA